MSRTLVLGSMPAEAKPQSHIAAGPWCFAGRENLFPDWESTFIFAPEPLAETGELSVAAHAAQTLCVLAIPKIAQILTPHAGSLPAAYWQTLLAPWAIDVAKQIVDRSLRTQAMLQKWRDQELVAHILPENCGFNFANEHDFTLRGSLGLTFNHWLFSRLLENQWPAKWRKISLEPVSENPVKKPLKSSFTATARKFAGHLLLSLPFPRLKGMSPLQATLFSLALRHPCNGEDHSRDLRDFWDESALARISLPKDWLSIFVKCLPASIKNLDHPQSPLRKAAPRLRVASIMAYENAEYRQKLALWRAKGNRLAYAQHGGNYGQIRVACDTELVEYSQDAFFTWGWKKHGDSQGNFLPMPYPQLALIKNKWHGSPSSRLIFVGTEMACYGYRLNSSPTPLQIVKYRKMKEVFFRNLPAEVRARFLYRPYFTLPGCLADAAWLLPQFPEIGLCQGSLLPQILSCGLLLLDHHGTTMLEALAANIPLVMYWNKKDWPLTDECGKLLDMLEDCGIWRPTPEAAAKKVLEIHEDPASWWACDKIQEARLEYCQAQARTDITGINSFWMKTLRKL